jgi:hypothetical protein
MRPEDPSECRQIGRTWQDKQTVSHLACSGWVCVNRIIQRAAVPFGPWGLCETSVMNGRGVTSVPGPM